MFKRVIFFIVIFSILFLVPFIYYKTVENFEIPTKQEVQKEKNAENPEQEEEKTGEKEIENEEAEPEEKKEQDETVTPPHSSDKSTFTEVDADFYIVGLGDSLTQGVGDPTGRGYIGMIKDRIESTVDLDVALYNFGKRGQRSDQLLQTLEKEDTRKALAEANIIFMTIGANDVMEVFKNHFFQLEISLFEKKNQVFRDHLREAFRLIRQENPTAPIYLIGLFNPFINYFSDITEIEQIIHMWNNSSEEVAAEFMNIHFVPIQSIFTNNEESLLYEDNFHPNSRGYSLIADKVIIQMVMEEAFTNLNE